MRPLPIIFFLSLAFYGIFAQQQPPSFDFNKIEQIVMSELDNTTLIEQERKRRAAGEVHEFAKAHKTNITPKTHGNWEFTSNGRAIWRVRIYSKAAKSLNFGFSNYQMPQGGKLTLYSNDFKDIKGPFTAEDNENHQQLWTPIILGEETILEVNVPVEKKEELSLTLAQVSHDFLGFGTLFSQRCHVDVVCDKEDGWELLNDYRDIIRSVGLYFIGGVRICTGFLVNNARQDCRPYFMTADHCGVNSSNAPSVVVYWNYENQSCRPVNSVENGRRGDGPLDDFNTGSTLLAKYRDSDMMLLELDDPVSKTANAFFAGWNNSAVTPDTTICIHHPNTEEKRISFSYFPTYTGTWARDDERVEDGNHLIVPSWSIGSTEGGSSGAPLFNSGKEIIGQLHGGEASCGNDNYDSYGLFHTSWEGGGTIESSLKSWLDPDNLNLTQLAGFDQSNCGRNILPDAYKKTVCIGDTANYQLLFADGMFSASELRVEGLMEGIDFQFSSDTIGVGIDTINLQLFGFQDLGNTANTFKIIAQDTSLSSELLLQVVVLDSRLSAPLLVSPMENAPAVSVSALFVWETDALGADFQLQVATDTTFENIVLDTVVLQQSSFAASNLAAGIAYYWRIKTINNCGESEWSPSFAFTTAICTQYFSEDIPIEISSGSPRSYTSTILVPEEGGIADVNVIQLKGRHTWVSDLTFTLASPEGTLVELIERPCFDESDFDIQFDDESTTENIICPITDGFSYLPKEPLSNFDGEPMQGEWILQFRDNESQDGGSLEAWGIEVCKVSEQFDISLSLSQDTFLICDESSILFDVTVGNAFNMDQIRLEIQDLPLGVTRTIQPSADNLFEASIRLNNLNELEEGTYNITIIVEDGTFSSKNTLFLQVIAPPELTLLRPFNQTEEVLREELLFEWESSTAVGNYKLDIAIDSLFDTITYTVLTDLTFHTPADSLRANQTYFWRVSAANECGNGTSETYKFRTETISNTQQLSESDYRIFPNPTDGFLQIEMNIAQNTLELFATNGKLLQRSSFTQRTTLDLSHYPAGLYWIKLVNAKGMIVKKVIVN
ncbi:MAG: T9SS type A sorting domain-containing protein [Bacteroidota bacterium]